MAGESEFSTADHFKALKEGSCDRQKRWDDDNDAKLRRVVENIKVPYPNLVLRTKHMGYRLTIRATMVTGTVLSATEFCGFLCPYYDVTPPNL